MTVNYKEYALALFELLTEEGSVDKCYDELSVVYEVLKRNPEYIKLLSSNMLSFDEKCNLAEKAFSGIDNTILKFLKLLISKKIVSALPKCIEVFFELYYDNKGILRAEVISAIEISDEEASSICEKLKGITGKNDVRLTKKINPALIGGAVLRFDGKEIDYSLKTKLNNLKTRLIEK